MRTRSPAVLPLVLSFIFTACSDRKPIVRDFPTMRVINASLAAEAQAKSAMNSSESIVRSQLEAQKILSDASNKTLQAGLVAESIENKAKVMGLEKSTNVKEKKGH